MADTRQGEHAGDKAVTPRTIVERFFTEVIPGEPGAAPAQLLSDKIVVHGAGRWDVTGRAAVLKLLEKARTAVPHFEIAVDSILEVGDIAVCRWTGAGSLTGVWPIPVIALEVPGAISVFRVSEQRIAEIWALDPSFDPSDWENDDEDGPVGGASAGPRWIPPKPQAKSSSGGKRPPPRDQSKRS